jgi:hypothetical protein
VKVKKTGTIYEITLEGQIGEACPLFNHDVRDATKIVIDGSKMTYINSIGVKNWILWTVRIPAKSPFLLEKLPLVMINQASTVKGFLPRHASIESFFAPYVCPDCNTEKVLLLTRGKDYQYASPGVKRMVNLPKVECPKCKAAMEADFLEAKTFSFLNAPT